MKHRIKFWVGWGYQFIFGLLLGFLVGFLVAIKPKGGSGILKNSDTLPFVLGMGLLFVTVVTQFCRLMDRRRDNPYSCTRPGFAEGMKHLPVSNILSILTGIVGIGLIIMSFLKTLKIMPR